MIVNRTALQSMFVGFKLLFDKAFEAVQPLYLKIATVIPSKTATEEYKWLGKIPRMREWLGERIIQNLTAFSYAIKNRDFELTIGVDRNDIEDDTIGVYSPLMQSMGQSAAMHPDELIWELLAKGFTKKCYDKQPFFSETHKDGKLTQSNLGTVALSVTSYGTARAQMMALKDENGNSLKIIPNLLVVPPQLEGIARKILFSEQIDSTTNVYKGTAELLVVPDLSGDATKWYLMDVSKPVKPLIFQERKKPEFVAKDKPEDDNVFNNKQIVYGVDSRDNAGFGLWQLAYGSTGASE
jgi:phage major head subunit gpT-like protein